MDTQQVRSVLTQRATELMLRDRALQKHLRGEDGRLEADFSDRVAFTEMDEVIEALDVEALAELRAIEVAIRRLDEGTYGMCVSCGDTIPPARMAAIPTATRCVECAAEQQA